MSSGHFALGQVAHGFQTMKVGVSASVPEPGNGAAITMASAWRRAVVTSRSRVAELAYFAYTFSWKQALDVEGDGLGRFFPVD
jgi:hypothetical protein